MEDGRGKPGCAAGRGDARPGGSTGTDGLRRSPSPSPPAASRASRPSTGLSIGSVATEPRGGRRLRLRPDLPAAGGAYDRGARRAGKGPDQPPRPGSGRSAGRDCSSCWTPTSPSVPLRREPSSGRSARRGISTVASIAGARAGRRTARPNHTGVATACPEPSQPSSRSSSSSAMATPVAAVEPDPVDAPTIPQVIPGEVIVTYRDGDARQQRPGARAGRPGRARHVGERRARARLDRAAAP